MTPYTQAVPVATVFLFCLAIHSLKHQREHLSIGIFRILAATGALLNSIAVASNQWKMPVAIGPIHSVSTHKLMNSATAFPMLCDVLWARSSIGDWFILLGGTSAWVAYCRFYGSKIVKDRSRLTDSKKKTAN